MDNKREGFWNFWMQRESKSGLFYYFCEPSFSTALIYYYSKLLSLLAPLLSSECQTHQCWKMSSICLQMCIGKEWWAQFCWKYPWIVGVISVSLKWPIFYSCISAVWSVSSSIAFGWFGGGFGWDILSVSTVQCLLLGKSKCSYCTYSSVGTWAEKVPLEAFSLV